MSIEIIMLGGTSPIKEKAAREHPSQSLANGKKMISILRKRFGDEPDRAKLDIKSEMTRLGQVFAVACSYDSDDAEATAYCRRIEGHMPSTWNDENYTNIKNPQK